MRRILHSTLPGLLILAAVAGCEPDHHAGVGAKGPSRPNIILITIESLRADHVGCYGYPHPTTPSLDALAREGILFEQARAVTSWTLASHATMFTGLYPLAHRVIRPHDRLDDSYETLAERLRAAGYQTAGYVSGPFLGKVHNLHQGFQIYDDSGLDMGRSSSAHGDVTNPWMEQEVVRFLTRERDPGKPFFLFVYLWDPHFDYIPPTPYNRMFVPRDAEPIDVRGYGIRDVVNATIRPGQLRYVISQYDGEIRWTDDLLGRLWERLRAAGLWGNTAIIVTADHGEAFFEHGVKGHKNNLYIEEIHVPLIIKPPGRNPARRDVRIANLVRLFPTVLDLARLDQREPHAERSLLKPRRPNPPPTFFELETSAYFWYPSTREMEKRSQDWFAIRDGRYKLVESPSTNRFELYDVAMDLEEKNPLDGSHRAFKPLAVKLEMHRREMERLARKWSKSERARLMPAQEDRLRALGYVGTTVTEPAGRASLGSGR